MIFKRRRKQVATEPSSKDFWKNHGRKDGEIVQCDVCHRTLRIRLWKDSEAATFISTPEVFEGIALICADCGRFFCAECSTPGGEMMPVCDRCQRRGGVTIMLG